MKKLLIIAMALALTACASTKSRIVVSATVESSQQYCSPEQLNALETLLVAGAGGWAGSKLGGGNMKKVNSVILAGAAVTVANNEKSKKTNCNQYLNVLSFKNPYTNQKMQKQHKTNHPMKVGSKIHYETLFDNPYK